MFFQICFPSSEFHNKNNSCIFVWRWVRNEKYFRNSIFHLLNQKCEIESNEKNILCYMFFGIRIFLKYLKSLFRIKYDHTYFIKICSYSLSVCTFHTCVIKSRLLNNWAVIQVSLAERKDKLHHFQIHSLAKWIMSNLQRVHMMLKKI